MKSDATFKFSHNGYGYEVLTRASHRILGTVARRQQGWVAADRTGTELPGFHETRRAAAWALFTQAANACGTG